ncbi:unnamed protein product (macronuclear) [Paramecium tetraurelia]|uniref:Transmembrane protein n=1 Tax=Paramecium tetraurelia TaxID=5888 RepID=A0DKT5_PARTE|nr:uncharacterized protein GSPATT00017982001 [Paramecium tetraurelia]CAK83652.1 unnamed protein product [Paramecium tetraurelia]|eukprot:XP_001451049.1 hypothetical protein (macronuclear) [Paramecium tetraurelia strain d4-2]
MPNLRKINCVLFILICFVSSYNSPKSCDLQPRNSFEQLLVFYYQLKDDGKYLESMVQQHQMMIISFRNLKQQFIFFLFYIFSMSESLKGKFCFWSLILNFCNFIISLLLNQGLKDVSFIGIKRYIESRFLNWRIINTYSFSIVFLSINSPNNLFKSPSFLQNQENEKQMFNLQSCPILMQPIHRQLLNSQTYIYQNLIFSQFDLLPNYKFLSYSKMNLVISQEFQNSINLPMLEIDQCLMVSIIKQHRIRINQNY